MKTQPERPEIRLWVMEQDRAAKRIIEVGHRMFGADNAGCWQVNLSKALGISTRTLHSWIHNLQAPADYQQRLRAAAIKVRDEEMQEAALRYIELTDLDADIGSEVWPDPSLPPEGTSAAGDAAV